MDSGTRRFYWNRVHMIHSLLRYCLHHEPTPWIVALVMPHPLGRPIVQVGALLGHPERGPRLGGTNGKVRRQSLLSCLIFWALLPTKCLSASYVILTQRVTVQVPRWWCTVSAYTHQGGGKFSMGVKLVRVHAGHNTTVFSDVQYGTRFSLGTTLGGARCRCSVSQ